jgi:hypothetical protein
MARRSPAGKLRQIRKIIRAWEDFAPGSVFYGHTLAQFKAAVHASEETRALIDDLQRRLRVAIHDRDVADATSMHLCGDVVNGVKGDRDHGDDGALYAAMGYTRASVRYRRRRKKTRR